MIVRFAFILNLYNSFHYQFSNRGNVSNIPALTRAWPGFLPNAIDRGGGRITPPRLTPKPMTAARWARRRWKGLGETVLKHPYNFSEKVTCQVKVRSKVKIERFSILVLRTANLTQTGPNSAETLSKVRRRYCMSVNAILSTGQGHSQVTKGHYIQKSHCGHVIHVLWPILAI